MTLRALLLLPLPLLLLACGGSWANRDLEFASALPSKAQLRSKLPTTTSTTSPLTGGLTSRRDGLLVGTELFTPGSYSVGSDALNMKLSGARANSVREYMIGQGVEATRLTAIGFGKTKPIADNGTADGREMNRRVEFTIVKE